MKNIPLEKVASEVAGLGVPGLVLTVVIATTGLSGAAAITAALSMIGPGGMLGGIATLGVAALVTRALSEFGIDAVITAVVKVLLSNGESRNSIRDKVSKYWISHRMKLKLYDVINNS